MDLYETYRKAISPTLMRRSVGLSLLGMEGVAWLYPAAIAVIECIDEMGGKVLGGDVLSIDGHGMRATGDSWYFADGLSRGACAAASIDYIKRYHCKNGSGYAYRLVLQYGEPGQEDSHILSLAFQETESLSLRASRLILTWSDIRYGFSRCYPGLDDVASLAMKLVERHDASVAALKLAYEENGVSETKELLRDVTGGDYDEQGARELWRHICCLERLAAV